jgi:uncharacterized protein YqeY
MMIWEQLNADMKTALKGGDKLRLSVVRMLISELKNERIAQGADLDDSTQRKVVQSYAKRRKEAIEAARAGGRDDVASKEQMEYDITVSYLPKQLSDDELRAVVKKHVEAAGAATPSAFGAVMKSVMAEIGGQADGKLVSALVRELIG